MQSVHSLKRPLDSHKNPLRIRKLLTQRKPLSSINKEPMRKKKPPLNLTLLKENLSPLFPQETQHNQNTLLERDKDYDKANSYLSTIEDPLWKHVCNYIINMMGPASLLKIKESALGDICSQNQSVDILCSSEDVAQFIQQYDFVILGSLQPYFPALKQLKIKIISTL